MKANTLENIPPHFLPGPSVISSLGEADEIIEDPTKKDKFGTTKALRIAISRQYEIIEVLGKGSYGCVSKAKCKTTGRVVALKVMENQTDTEYDTIKLVREIQLMRRLNQICKKFEGASQFIPELIDVICPDSEPTKYASYTPDTFESANGDSSQNNSGKDSQGYKD